MDQSSHNSWIGRRLGGRYEILDVIGEGGMGVVYRAKQVSIDRVVAIKMMHARAAQDPQWVDRFHSEAKACSLLTHPNTVRLYDFGQTTLGNLYMVMEFLEGRSLRQVIHAEGPLDAARVLRILMQCSASLSEAHAAGVIHRDIKPENIIVQDLAGASDFIKLFDFSIAKRADHAMTAAGMVFGTPQFMSPEQARGKGIDHRSDLYSLGVVAYAMLSASLPFHHKDSIEVLKMHQTARVPPLPDYVPSSVARVVMACLEKEPARRPASALALLEASKVWLTQIDPTLDVASDPVLKNTLITTGHPMPEDIPTENLSEDNAPTFVSASTSARTLLSASGASAIHHGSAVQASPAQHDEPAALASPPANEIQPGVRNPANSMIATMIQHTGGQSAGSSPGDQKATRIQKPRERPDEARTKFDAGNNLAATGASVAPADSVVASVQAPPPSGASATWPLPAQPHSFETPAPRSQRRGTGAFVLLCVLVAATFGAGGYYLTALLR